MKFHNIQKVLAIKVLTVLAFLSLFGCTHARPELSFQKPEPQHWTASNGMEVLFLENQDLPIVSGVVYIRGGALIEPKAHAGSFGAMGVLWRQGGAGEMSADQLDRELEKLSAAVSTSVGQEFSTVGFASLSSDFDRTFDIFSTVLLHPRFEPSRLSLWKSSALEDIRRRKDEPMSMVGISFTQLLYGDTVYGRVLTSTEVKRINTEELQAAHALLARPDGAVLVVTGAITREKLQQAVERDLSGWKSRGMLADTTPAIEYTPKPAIYFIEGEYSQSAVYIGQQGVPRLTPDYIAIDGFNQLFGSGAFGSRLMKKVRAELGLVYSISGGVYAGSVKGKTLIGFQTKAATTGLAIKESIGELIKLKDSAASTEELSEVKHSIENSFVFKFDTADDVVNRVATMKLLHYPSDYDETYLPRINAMTPAEVQKVAQERWDTGKFVIVVAGNKSAYNSVEAMLKDPPSYLKGYELKRVKFDEKLRLQ